MPIQIQYRRGTAAQWSSSNPLLAVGEPGYETDTGKFKVGDGSTNWNSLPYSSGIQGTTGIQGSAGVIGFDGAQGTTGTQGIQGLQGLQGTTGTQGQTGTQGAQGTQGIQGLQGIIGRTYTGVTSTTSVAIGTGNKTLSVSNSGAYVLGQRVRVAYTVTPSNFFEGEITSITTDSSITVASDYFEGSGTFTSWVFSTAGAIGIQGTEGAQGTQGLQGFGFAQLQGIQGTQGLQGTTGIQGFTGLQGTIGITPNAFVPVFSIQGPLTVVAGTHRLYVEQSCTISSVRASVGVAPTGSSLIVDINKNGTTIYGTQANRPTITASGFTALGGTASVTSLIAGDYLTVDIDQIGSTISGSDLTVVVTLVN